MVYSTFLSNPIFDPILHVMDALFNPLISLDPTPTNPILTIFVISFGVSLLTVIAQKLLVDQDKMNRIQDEMKSFQAEMREAQKSGDSKKLAKLQANQVDLMSNQSEMMKMSFKPLIVTMVPIMLIFGWMFQSAIHSIIVVLPPAVYYCTLTPIFHSLGQLVYGGSITTIPYGIGWLFWYFICTFSMSQILRKYMGFKNGF